MCFGGVKIWFFYPLHSTCMSAVYIVRFYYKRKSFSHIQNPTYSKIYCMHGNNGCNGDAEDFWYSILMWRFTAALQICEDFFFNFIFACTLMFRIFNALVDGRVIFGRRNVFHCSIKNGGMNACPCRRFDMTYAKWHLPIYLDENKFVFFIPSQVMIMDNGMPQLSSTTRVVVAVSNL